jgi:hypothetical protein
MPVPATGRDGLFQDEQPLLCSRKLLLPFLDFPHELPVARQAQVAESRPPGLAPVNFGMIRSASILLCLLFVYVRESSQKIL